MVSIIWATVSMMAGLMIYIALPMSAMTLPVELRRKIGMAYFKLAARCLKQFTFVRRVLSGYDIYPIKVDDEQKLLKVTLSSSVTGSDNAYPFKDPDNRVKRLLNKPVALAYEKVPAAVDAELAELGYWVGEKGTNEGLIQGDPQKDPGSVTVDPYVEVDDGLRLVDPVDVFNIVPNDVDPENVKTAENLTKKRFEKYGDGVGVTEMMTGILGFSVGAGAIMVMEYINQNIIGNGGGSGDLPSSPLGLVQPAIDTVVMLI